MKTTIKDVTPQWAAQILETRNVQNRHISDRVVEKYATDMVGGNWCLTHQGIAFDVNGDLLDGQHRLAAVVKANRTIQMLVTTGIPATFKNNGHETSVFSAIDGLKPRTPAIQLELLGYKNAKTAASTARAVAALVVPDKSVQVSGANVIQVLRLMGGSIEKVASLGQGAKIVRIRTWGLACIAFWHTSQPEKAEAFLSETQTVTGAKKSPTRALASWLNNSVKSGGQAQINLLYVTCSAIFHAAQGNSTEKLYGSEESVKWLISTNKSLASKIASLFKP